MLSISFLANAANSVCILINSATCCCLTISSVFSSFASDIRCAPFVSQMAYRFERSSLPNKASLAMTLAAFSESCAFSFSRSLTSFETSGPMIRGASSLIICKASIRAAVFCRYFSFVRLACALNLATSSACRRPIHATTTVPVVATKLTNPVTVGASHSHAMRRHRTAGINFRAVLSV